ncbi:unnamed protein product [Adineta ricciae]|uniref:Uncharacterized protein n=1 Tax=Adineta ricciae TaxID=249248 RepID=A0A814JGM9_ADIRI|nr:unnamed protein product [Adineta ricciae]CAF1375119.1 unnamed protein product [Adineta ricciae]
MEINQFITSTNTAFYLAKDFYGEQICGVTLNTYPLYDEVDYPDLRNFALKCRCDPLNVSHMVSFSVSPHMSNLERLYNQTCVSHIQQFIDSTLTESNFTKPQLSTSSNNVSIESLTNDLFVQSWTNESSYQLYFNQCQPWICEYLIESHLEMVYIITTILGLIGGLNTILHLLLPIIFSSVFNIRNYFTHQSQSSRGICSSCAFTRRSIIELNLFRDISS